MKILVCVKRVSDPDNANKVKVAGDGTSVNTEGLEFKTNPFDDWAVETALRLNENGQSKEKLGDTIVVSIGPPDTAQVIRQCLAMGADRGVLIKGEDRNLDASVIARALKVIVEREKPDLVLLGKQTVDGETGAVPQMLAEYLGWPMATFATSIRTGDSGKTLEVGRESDLGALRIRVTAPAVISVTDRILLPRSVQNGATPADFAYPESDSGRYASLKGIMAAKKKPIEELDIGSLGVDTTPASAYAAFALPPARSGQTTFVENAQDLVQRLRNEAKAL